MRRSLRHCTEERGEGWGRQRSDARSINGEQEISDDSRPRPLPPETRGVLKFLESQLAIQFELKRQPWKRCTGSRYGWRRSDLWRLENRRTAQGSQFSEALYEDQIWLVTRCDSMFPFRTLQDLKARPSVWYAVLARARI